jgi:riboflavin kinase / FMN adenylyltransferase
MRIFRHAGKYFPRGAVIAIGNFDGVHLGHRAVIAAAKKIADEKGAPLAVLTFEPHPRRVFTPATKPFRLTPFRAKSRLLAEAGVDLLLTLRFNRAFAAVSADDFAGELLAGRLGVAHVAVGPDFTFGRGRAGNTALLQSLAPRLGFAVSVVAPVSDPGGTIYSASRIRDHLEAGRPREAASLLGRAWEIEGRVRRGDRRGRDLGFPTANLAIADYLHPLPGVYAVRAGLEENGALLWRDGVADFGNRPTFSGEDWRFETYIFDFAGDLYGRQLRVALTDFIRPDIAFAGEAALIRQMREDEHAARALLAART